MPSTITLPSGTYTLITMPSSSGAAAIDFDMVDTVAVVPGVFVPSQVQTQDWPGADSWEATITLPPTNFKSAPAWKAFLAECRGMQNVFQLADPEALAPTGSAPGTPLVDGTVDTNNAVASTVLYTRGWTASQANILLPNDHLQIGYRLYMVCEAASSDSSGKSQIQIWPSLRDQPADGTGITLDNPMGLFRLASNRRGWKSSPQQLTAMSFKVAEVR